MINLNKILLFWWGSLKAIRSLLLVLVYMLIEFSFTEVGVDGDI